MTASPPPPNSTSKLILLFVLLILILFASISIAFSQSRPPTADSLTTAQRRECLRYRAEAEYFHGQMLRKDSVIVLKDKLITHHRRQSTALKAGIITLTVILTKTLLKNN